MDHNQLVTTALADPKNAWSIGTFGAIAEFTRDDDEAAEPAVAETGTSAVTGRGAIAVGLPGEAQVVAYEALSGRPERWLQGVAFCLPTESAALGRRAVLSELGPDGDALRDADRGAVLFDMGLGQPHLDVCVRTADGALIDLLRAQCGRSLLAADNPAMGAIKDASPHRVFRSAAGRIEVYQHIGSTSRNVPTPEGPHTHVLPGLLKTGRTHGANVPVPEGLVPVLTLHPANPFTDLLGRDKPFDRAAHDAFQAMIERFPPVADYTAEKARIADAVRGGGAPSDYAEADSRVARLGARIMLRQLGQLEPDLPALADWRARFDRVKEGADPHEH